MKKIVIVLMCAVLSMTCDCFAARRGYGHSRGGGHGINGCGYKYCHGDKCRKAHSSSDYVAPIVSPVATNEVVNQEETKKAMEELQLKREREEMATLERQEQERLLREKERKAKIEKEIAELEEECKKWEHKIEVAEKGGYMLAAKKYKKELQTLNDKIKELKKKV